MTDAPEYVLERTFDAPRDLVWRAWTDPALLAQWYGPGVETIIHAHELKTGGLWLLEMRWSGGGNFQRAEYIDVTPPERLVFLLSMTDDDWNIASNPMMPNWPRVLLTTVTFEPAGEATTMRLVWTPHEATDAETACFAEAVGGMDKGWSAGMDMLAKILSEMRAEN